MPAPSKYDMCFRFKHMALGAKAVDNLVVTIDPKVIDKYLAGQSEKLRRSITKATPLTVVNQKTNLLSIVPVNAMLAELERTQYDAAGNAAEYEAHFMRDKADRVFETFFSFVGVNQEPGAAVASWIDSAGPPPTAEQQMTIIVGGQTEMLNYFKDAHGFIEGAAIFLVLKRVPITGEKHYDFSMDRAPRRLGHTVSVKAQRGPAMGRYDGTMYAPQLSLELWPDGDHLPIEFTAYTDPWTLGSKAYRLGRIFHRNHEDPRGLAPYQNPLKPEQLQPVDSAAGIRQRRPVSVMLRCFDRNA